MRMNNIGRKLNGGVIIKPSYNGHNPIDMLIPAEKIGIIKSETVGRIIARMVAEGIQSHVRNPQEMQKVLRQLEKEVMNV